MCMYTCFCAGFVDRHLQHVSNLHHHDHQHLPRSVDSNWGTQSEQLPGYLVPELMGALGCVQNEITAQAQKIAVEKQRLDRLESERSAENFDFQSKRNHTRDILAAVQQLLANLERIPLQLVRY